MNSVQEQASVFAQIVDKLRTKTDAELKMLYMQFFKDEFTSDWETITAETDFNAVTDDDIITAIENKRYKSN